jgi:hypothetical protein
MVAVPADPLCMTNVGIPIISPSKAILIAIE